MSRRLMLALFAALTLSLTVAAAAAGTNQPSTQESGNPINDQGSSYHYRTYVTSVTPTAPGLSVEVLEFADRLLLRNHTGKTVIVYGYSGEPYARLLPNGSTEQNGRSPAVYLNTNFYANVTVPKSASATAAPRWESLDRAGQFEWHDHRIHWMSPVTPPQVKDKNKRTKIFDWTVPIKVGSQPGAIKGELFWVPQGSNASTGTVAVLAAIVAALLLGAILVRRRRKGGGSRGEPEAGSPEPPAQREAW